MTTLKIGKAVWSVCDVDVNVHAHFLINDVVILK